MASNPSRAHKKEKSSKRKQGECSQAIINRLDTWFTDEGKKSDYKVIYAIRNVRVSKYLDLELFSQQGFNFPNLLEVQRLTKLVKMKWTFYPKLVKVFVHMCSC